MRHAKTQSLKVIGAKVWAAAAALSLVVMGLVSAVIQAPLAQAADPVLTAAGDGENDWRKPATICGQVFVDKTGGESSLNSGDTPLAGLELHAEIITYDGFVLPASNMGGVVPAVTTTNANGNYCFNFQAAFADLMTRSQLLNGYQAHNGRAFLQDGDYIKVWLVDSAKATLRAQGVEPTWINGAERFTYITALTKSFLGTTITTIGTGYITYLNFPYKSKPREYTAGMTPTSWSEGFTMPQAQWLPSAYPGGGTATIAALRTQNGASADASPQIGWSLAANGKKYPFVCGQVYTDVSYSFELQSAWDKPRAGMHVAVTSYDATGALGSVVKPLATRTAVTDAQGQYCVAFEPDEFKQTNSVSSPKFSQRVYDPATYLLPEGYSLGERPYQNGRVNTQFCSNLGVPNCTPAVPSVGLGGRDMMDLGALWSYPFTEPKIINTHIGLIKTSPVQTLDHLYGGLGDTVKVTATKAIPVTAPYGIVAVKSGDNPNDASKRVAVVPAPDTFANDTFTVNVPMKDKSGANLPAGTYTFYLVTMDGGSPVMNMVHDADQFQVLDTKAWYYTDAANQDQTIAEVKAHRPGITSTATAGYPGAAVKSVFTSLIPTVGPVPGHNYALFLAPKGTADNAVTSQKMLESGVVAGSDDPYFFKYNFTIPNGTTPGDYEFVLVDTTAIAQFGTTGIVARDPYRVLPPKITAISPVVVKPGGSAQISVEGLDSSKAYTLTFADTNGANPVTINVAAGQTGPFSFTTAAATAIGLGSVKLAEGAKVWDQKALNISTVKVYGPEIILPGQQDPNANMDGVVGAPNQVTFHQASCTPTCEAKWGAPAGTRIYRMDSGSGTSLNIYAVDPQSQGIIRGGTNVAGGTWQILKVERWGEGGDGPKRDPGTEGSVQWGASPDVFTKGSTPIGYYYNVTLKVTNSAGLSDTKNFILYPALGGQYEYGSQWQVPAVLLNVNQPIPANTYCVRNVAGQTVTEYAKSASIASNYPVPNVGLYQWPAGVNIDSNGCLSGTPTAVTPNAGFVNSFVMAKVDGYVLDTTGWKNIITRKQTQTTIPPIRIAVRNAPDTVAPVFTDAAGSNVAAGNELIVPIKTSAGGAAFTQKIGVKDNTAVTAVKVDDPLGSGAKVGASVTTATPLATTANTVNNITISGTLPAGTSFGDYPLSVAAVDAAGNLTQHRVIFRVSDGIAPTIAGVTEGSNVTGAPAGRQGQNYNFVLPAITDEAGGSGLATVTGEKDGLKVIGNPDGTYAITGKLTASGTITVPVVATDKAGNKTTVNVPVTVAAVDTNAPTLTGPDTIVLEVGHAIGSGKNASVATAFTAADTEAGNLNARITVAPNGTYPNDLPPALFLDAGKVSGTPSDLVPTDPTQVGKDKSLVTGGTGADERQILLSVSDGTNTVTKVVTVKVVDTTPPALAVPQKISAVAQSATTIPVTTSDLSGYPVNVEVSGLAGFSYNPASGTITGNAPAPGTYELTIKATDSSGNTVTKTMQLYVSNEFPTVNLTPAAQTKLKPESGSATIDTIAVNTEPGARISKVGTTTIPDNVGPFDTPPSYDLGGGLTFTPKAIKANPDDPNSKYFIDPSEGTVTGAVAASTTIAIEATNAANNVGSASAAITLEVGPPNAAKSSVSVTTNDQTANGTAKDVVTVTLRDANNNPVKGKLDAIVRTATGLDEAVWDSGVDNNDGTYTFAVTSKKVGSLSAEFKLDGTAITGSPAALNFKPGAPADFLVGPDGVTPTAQRATTITVAPASDEVNVERTATLTLKDAFGNLIPDQVVSFTSSGGTLTAASAKTDSNGVATVKLNSSAPGVFTVTGTAGALSVTTDPGATFTTGALNLANSKVEIVEKDAKIADGTSANAHTVRITLKDSAGNPITGKDVGNFQITAPTGVSVATLTETSTPGVYEAKVTTTTAGSHNIAVDYLPTANDETTKVRVGADAALFKAGEPALTTNDGSPASSVNIPDSAVAGAPVAGSATVKDVNGNPISGHTVVLSSPGGTFTDLAGNPITSATTGDDGIAHFKFVPTTTGTQTVTATVSDSVKPTDTTEVSAGPADASKSTFTVLPAGPLPVGTGAGSTYTATVTIKDANGNPVGAGKTVSLVASSNDLIAGNAGPYVTNAQGQVEVTYTSTVAGSPTLQARLGADTGAQIGQTLTLAYAAGALDLSKSQYTVTTGQKLADGTATHKVTITLRDGYNNLVAGGTIGKIVHIDQLLTVTLTKGLAGGTGGTGSAVIVDNGPYKADSNGIIELELATTTAGTYPIEVTGVPNVINKDAIFVSGPLDASKSTATVTTNNQAADGTAADVVTVTLRDTNGNPVAVDPSKISFSAAPAGLNVGAFAEVAGQPGVYAANITSTKAGTFPLTVSVNPEGTAIALGSVSPVFVPGPISTATSSVSATTGPKAADGTATHTVTIQLKDAQGNPITGKSTDLSVNLSPATVGEASEITEDTTNPGTYTFTVTSTNPGTVTATVKSGTDTIGSPVDMSFTGRPATPILNPSNGTIVKGEVPGGIAAGTPVKITYTDQNGAQQTATGTVDANGKFNITLPTPAKHGSQISAVVTDTATGYSSLPGKTIVDSVKPDAPTINPSNGASVSGTAEPGTTVTLTYKDKDNNPQTVKVPVKGDGTYDTGKLAVPIPDGNTVTATATDAAGNVSPDATRVVDGNAPWVAVQPSKGDVIEGTGEVGAVITIKDDAGQEIGTAIVGTEGKWTFTPTSPLADGTKLLITAKDSAGNESAPVTLVVDSTPPSAPVVNATRGDKVGGTADPGTVVDVTYTDPATSTTKTIKNVPVGTDGKWSLPNTFSPLLPAGSTVSAVSRDSAGNVSAAGTTIVDQTKPTLTLQETPSQGDKVTGKTDPGNTVTASYAVGGGAPVTLKTTVDADGNLVVVTTDGSTIPNNAVVTVVATDTLGNTSSGTVSVDSAAPAAPIAQTSNGKTLTGTAEAGTTVKVYDEAGTQVGTGEVDDNGKFTVTFAQPVPNGTKLTVTATDQAGNTSGPGKSVVDSQVPDLSLNPSNGQTVTGKTEPGAKVVVTYPGPGGTTVTIPANQVVVNPDGTFTATPTTPIPHGIVVSVTAADQVGNTTPPQKVTVDSQPPTAPKVDQSDGKSITGTTEPGAKVTLTYKDDGGNTITAEVTADDKGKFVYVPTSPIPNGTEVSVTATDAAGNTSPATKRVVDSDAPPLTVAPSNGTTIKGVTEPNATVTITLPDGTAVDVTAGPDGKFTYTPATPLADGDKVSLQAKDGADNTSPVETITIDKNAPLLNLQDSRGDSIKGKSEPNTKVTLTLPDGSKVSVTTDYKGEFTYTPATPFSDGQVVTAVATDAAGNTSPIATITIDRQAPAKPTVDPSAGASVTGTAPLDAKQVIVTYQDKDGNTQTVTAPVDPVTGKYAASLDPAAADGTKIEVKAEDKAGNISEPASVIVDATAPAAPVVNPSNGTTVTGKAEPNAKVTITYIDVDGNERTQTVTADSQGDFTATLSPAAKDGSTISAKATDVTGNTGPAGTAKVDSSAPTAPVVNPSNGTTVTGKAEPNSVVTVKDPAGNPIGSATAGADGSYTVTLTTPQPDGTKLTVTATDSNNNESLPSEIVVDKVVPDAPSVDVAGPTTISGKAEPNSVVTVKDPAGNPIGSATAGADGSYTVTLTTPQPDGTKLTVTAKDPSGNESTGTQVSVDGKTTVQVYPSDGTIITGKAEPGAKVTLTLPDGTKADVTAGPDGKFSYTPTKRLLDGVKVIVVATDKSGNTANAEVVIKTEKPLAPQVQPSTGDSLDGTGTPGNIVIITIPGRPVIQVEVDPDGNWHVDLRPTLSPGTEVSISTHDPATGATSDPIRLVIDAKPGGDPVGPSQPVVPLLSKTGADSLSLALAALLLLLAGGALMWRRRYAK